MIGILADSELKIQFLRKKRGSSSDSGGSFGTSRNATDLVRRAAGCPRWVRGSDSAASSRPPGASARRRASGSGCWPARSTWTFCPRRWSGARWACTVRGWIDRAGRQKKKKERKGERNPSSAQLVESQQDFRLACDFNSSTTLFNSGFPLGFTRVYWVLPGFTGFYWVLLSFHKILLGFTWFYWVLMCFTWFYWVLLSFDKILLSYTWFYLGFTGFY